MATVPSGRRASREMSWLTQENSIDSEDDW